jgi:hypothetical protein
MKGIQVLFLILTLGKSLICPELNSPKRALSIEFRNSDDALPPVLPSLYPLEDLGSKLLPLDEVLYFV